MADENVTGATVGDVRYLVAYLDVNTNNLYDANGNLYGNSTLTSTLGNEFVLELHYVKDISTSENPDNWTVWDGLEGQTVSSTLAFDNDFVHALEGSVTADTAIESTSIEVNVSNLDKDTLSPAGILVINPFEITFTNPNTGMTINQKVMVNYSSFEFVEGTTNTYRFMITDIDGLEVNVPAGVLVRVSDPMYMLVDSDSIYEANIQPRFDEGVFKFPMKILSRKLLKALDYSNSSGVSGTLEHNIYIERNNLNGVVASGSTNICYRDKSLDKVAQDIDYYAWQNTSGGITTTLYTKSEIPVLNEKVYKKLSNGTLVDANMVVSSDSSTASSTQIKKADGTGLAATYTKTLSLNEYAPYVFCGWNDKANTNPTIYYTKGNDIQDGTVVYSIDAETNIATVVSGTTVDPTYDTDYVLYRTFSFPFIVKNLVDYGVSLNIPVDDTDWVKDYIISIVHNNMEEIVTVASNSVFGVVKIGGNIGVENGVISVATATDSIKGLVAVGANIDVSGGTISVKTGSTSDKGVVAIGTNLDVEGGTVSVKTADSTNLGLVSVGSNIDVVDGEISVKDASTSDKGVVQLTNSDDGMDSETTAITPKLVNILVGDVIAAKQNNLSNGNVTTLNTTGGAKIDVNVGDGLDVGVTGTTNANKLIVNEASVKEVLKDVVDGGTEPAVNEIVTADNLKGALSVGQAVDVSSPIVTTAWYANFPDENVEGEEPVWYQVGSSEYKARYLKDQILKCDFVIPSGSTTKMVQFGFDYNNFPKAAPGLEYIFMCELRNISGFSLNQILLKLYGHSASEDISTNQPYWANRNAPVESGSAFTRLVGLFGDGGTVGVRVVSAVSGTVKLEVKNIRQYEVTALTEDARAYLASVTTNPDPDKLFRSPVFADVASRYLVKSDMVNPWTYLIGMPTNSPAMAVGSGLAYQLSLTDGGEHEITVDTFPTDAYGQDSHIQLLLANNSTAVFKSPLNLIDALVPNAANNITVKFRAGQANVYLDDTDAGYVVTVTAGTESGSLYYGITGNTSTYVVFNKSMDEQEIVTSGTTTTRAYNIVGNGSDKTSIKLTSMLATSTNPFSLQGLTLTADSEFSTQGLTGQSGTNSSFIVSDCVLSGFTVPLGLHVFNLWQSNIQITGSTIANNSNHSTVWNSVVYVPNGAICKNDLFVDNDCGCICVYYANKVLQIDNCIFNNPSGFAIRNSGALVYISNTEFQSVRDYIIGGATAVTFLVGYNKTNSYFIGDAGKTYKFVDGATLDLTGNTHASVMFRGTSTNITGGLNISVVASTASNAAIGGTATVLYSSALDDEYDSNNEPFTKSRTISGGGAGYIMRANGSIGVPVTTTTAGQAGSLDTLLADNTVEQITFAPVVDVDTPTTGGICYIGATSGATVSVTGDFLAINGAGISKTSIGYGSLQVDTTNAHVQKIYLSGLTGIGIQAPLGDWNRQKYITIENCLFEGNSYIGEARIVAVTGTTFSNISNGSASVIKVGYPQIDNCIFDTCARRCIETCYYNDTYPTYIKNCTFSNLSIGAIMTRYGLTKLIENCTFTNCIRCIYDSGNLDANYSGTMTIKNCTFNTSTDKIYLVTANSQSNIVMTDNVIKCSITNNIFGTSTGTYRVTLSGNTISGDITASLDTDVITFSDSNTLNSTVSGLGTTTFIDGATLNLKTNTNENAISGGAVTVPANATVTIIPYGATQASQYVTITGPKTGTYIKNTGDSDLA